MGKSSLLGGIRECYSLNDACRIVWVGQNNHFIANVNGGELGRRRVEGRQFDLDSNDGIYNE